MIWRSDVTMFKKHDTINNRPSILIGSIYSFLLQSIRHSSDTK